MMTKLLLAAFLLAHGAIHASYLAPRPAVTAGGPQWPFDLTRSWALTPLGIAPDTARLLGIALVAVVAAGFALAAVAALGVVPSLWVPSVVLASSASIVLLVLFFHPWLVLGFAVDALLLYGTLVAGWIPSAGGVR